MTSHQSGAYKVRECGNHLFFPLDVAVTVSTNYEEID
jgi:hypothetical protein